MYFDSFSKTQWSLVGCDELSTEALFGRMLNVSYVRPLLFHTGLWSNTRLFTSHCSTGAFTQTRILCPITKFSKNQACVLSHSRFNMAHACYCYSISTKNKNALIHYIYITYFSAEGSLEGSDYWP